MDSHGPLCKSIRKTFVSWFCKIVALVHLKVIRSCNAIKQYDHLMLLRNIRAIILIPIVVLYIDT